MDLIKGIQQLQAEGVAIGHLKQYLHSLVKTVDSLCTELEKISPNQFRGQGESGEEEEGKEEEEEKGEEGEVEEDEVEDKNVEVERREEKVENEDEVEEMSGNEVKPLTISSASSAEQLPDGDPSATPPPPLHIPAPPLAATSKALTQESVCTSGEEKNAVLPLPSPDHTPSPPLTTPPPDQMQQT